MGDHPRANRDVVLRLRAGFLKPVADGVEDRLALVGLESIERIQAGKRPVDIALGLPGLVEHDDTDVTQVERVRVVVRVRGRRAADVTR